LKRLLCCLCFLFAGFASAQGLLPVPELTARVIDQTGTLDAIQRQGLEDKLAAFEQRKGTQIVMLIVSSTQPEDVASYANRVANAWKIGRREVGDGVLVVVAKDDRRVRVEIAKTLEGAIPDLAARRIIDEAMTPRFRQGDFAGGLQAAADQLMARVSGEALPEPKRDSRKAGSAPGFDWFDLAIFLFFVVPIVGGILRRIFGKLGPVVTGAGAGGIAMLITSSLLVAAVAGVIALVISLLSGGMGMGGRRARGGYGPWIGTGGWGGGGGGGGGWGGGGGFGSGGGDFGGGGASGDW